MIGSELVHFLRFSKENMFYGGEAKAYLSSIYSKSGGIVI